MADQKPYPFDSLEPKWQKYWVENKIFKAPDPGEPGSERPKYYILDMFPYPSGAGLHVGHPEGYTATDILSRYKRMRGFNVLHPMGWDAFGLPAEQYALETGTHPEITTKKNISLFKRQIQSLGFSYDWDREVSTTDTDYYRWTQWIFLQLYKKGLAYEAEVAVNWCPALGTVLANEEVIDGKSERGNHPVIRKPMRQWVLKITAYADRLLEDLKDLDWPEPIKEMQRNWIGKSIGAEVDFQIDARAEKVTVYTTRPDTLFGATYMVLAPEHPLVDSIVTAEKKSAIKKYKEEVAKKTDLQRTDLAKDKSGEFTGAFAINPVNQAKIPIWIADYVLMSYGTGAIMAVPAHDERDYEFATKFKLPIVEVISGGDISKEAFTGVGVCVNSETPDRSFSINGMKSDAAFEKTIAWLDKKGIGKKAVRYKLRDWLFSRQRYWGEPIPVIHVDGKPKPISEKELPLKLPETNSYQPTGTGESPLAGISNWVNTKDSETGKSAKRETNTMPQWAGSCWYYLRYIDPKNSERFLDSKKEKYWMPVDLYVGGAEHAVLHLLYSRFWHKVLFDLGCVSTKEPFQKLINQGMILGEDGQKMSKSRGNVINPDDVIRDYGADSLRLYEMFMGPLEMVKPWSMRGVEGVHRFLARAWRLFINREDQLNAAIANREATQDELKLLHQTIKKVTDDLEGMRFNTAISALMVFVNETTSAPQVSKSILETFLLLLAPFAPHIAEELWQRLGHQKSLAYEKWPTFDNKYLVEESVEIAVQVLGKIKARLVVPINMPESDLRSQVLADPSVKEAIGGREIKKFFVVPNRLVNIII